MTVINRIETLHLAPHQYGGHAEHWAILSHDCQRQVNVWLQHALDQPVSPLGLCTDADHLPDDVWLLQGPSSAIQLAQVVAVDRQQPIRLCTAFPVLNSPYRVTAQITRITDCPNSHQAVLQIQLADQTTLYGFDTLYAVNQAQYQPETFYQVTLSAWAYHLENVGTQEQLFIKDEAAIRHHRALNAILAAHDGKAPDNLQELLAQWQPQTPDDTAPLTLDLSRMVAYLYGETLGEEDEAWFQGDIVGKAMLTLKVNLLCFMMLLSFVKILMRRLSYA